MTVIWGDTGRNTYGPQRTATVTMASARETLLGSPVALPTTQPAGGASGAQISFTVQASDLPTITPTPSSIQYVAVVYIGGKNTDAASQTVSYQVFKNGTSVVAATTAASIPTVNYWTHSHWRFLNVSVGDVLAFSLWSSSANVNYDYSAIQIYPTRVFFGGKGIVNSASYTLNKPSLTQGTPSEASVAGVYVYPDSTGAALALTLNTVTTYTFPNFYWTNPYYTGRLVNGDGGAYTTQYTSTTYRPYYQRNHYFSQLTWRDINP